jgi:hypothetical protein
MYYYAISTVNQPLNIESWLRGSVTWLVRGAVGIWQSHQRDDKVMALAVVDVQRDVALPHLLRP